jgi:hypothetical protein
MIRKNPFTTLYCCCLVIIHVGCSSKNNAVTAEDFVKKHAKAYQSQDAKAVAEMTLCAEDLEETAIPQQIKLELQDQKRDSLIKDIKGQMKLEGDRWVQAWGDTRYVGEKDHGDHIHVDVTVGYARSSIVLVRAGKCLKLAPNPSSFE